MTENLRSMVIGTAGLHILAVIALALTFSRSLKQENEVRTGKLMQLFLIGLACQCFHCIEEFVTGFHVLFPRFLSLVPWPPGFFITLNLGWMAVWLLSAAGVCKNYRAVFFPVWFFALGMFANGIAHPLLALVHKGYFPGLFTSPLVGIVGFLMTRLLFQITEPASK